MPTRERRTNGGFFVLRQEIFDDMRQGEDLVEEPFQRLASEGKLVTYEHDGFWACMDTFRESLRRCGASLGVSLTGFSAGPRL